MMDTTTRGAGPPPPACCVRSAGPAPSRRRRSSAKRKQSAVLRLLRGDDLELVSRELCVTAVELSAWHDMFLAASEASLKTRPVDGRDAPLDCQAPKTIAAAIGPVAGQGCHAAIIEALAAWQHSI